MESSVEAATVEAQAGTEVALVEIALVDLSSIAHPAWHMSGREPDPDWTSREIVSRVRNLTRNHPKAAICCDSGRSFRRDISADYKANRPEREAALYHQIDLAIEQLKADGYPVWAEPGLEADDLIASAVGIALQLADTSALVISSDKDLLQLVGPRVRVLSPGSGQTYDSAGVVAKFKVRPEQIRDYLTLVGDSADNVKGAAGIGPVKAAELLGRWGSISGIYEGLDKHGTQFKPAMATALREFAPRLPEVQALITLRTDAAVPFAELDNDRAVPTMEVEGMSDTVAAAAEVVEAQAPEAVPAEPAGATSSKQDAEKPANGNGQHGPAMSKAPASTALAVPDAAASVPAEYERQLDPRNLPQAARLAELMFQSRMFSAYGSPQAVLSTILAGRELGLTAMASLRAFHIVENKPTMAADTLRALVLRSGLAEYFRCTERTATRCTFVTKRKGDPEPIALTHTIEEAQAAGVVKAKSGWEKYPADMLVARASSKLARLVYPEIGFGLYAPEEF